MYSDGVWSRSIWISEVLLYSYCENDAVINELFASIVFNNNFNHGRSLPTPRVSL